MSSLPGICDNASNKFWQGTQIAKDAADIILLDDNFASIVTAAKWGRNVYASIQKFLQFQLVNIAAVVTALVGSFAYAKSPLAAIQLLWVNLLMDALASLALASEPPTDALLKRDPVNRSKNIITRRMWGNMLGQATYQLVVIMFILFAGPEVFGLKPGHEVEREDNENSIHYTFIFNTFVWMQLFNEINSRSLEGDCNVFRGIHKNPLFCGILLTTAVLQVIMVEFGGQAMHVHEDGLSAEYWGYSLAFGVASLPIQPVINVFYSFLVAITASGGNEDGSMNLAVRQQDRLTRRDSCTSTMLAFQIIVTNRVQTVNLNLITYSDIAASCHDLSRVYSTPNMAQTQLESLQGFLPTN